MDSFICNRHEKTVRDLTQNRFRSVSPIMRRQEPQINFRKRDISSSELPLQLKVFKSQTFGHNSFASRVQLIPYQYIILSIKQNQFIRADYNSLHRLSVSTPKNAFIMVPTSTLPLCCRNNQSTVL